MSTRVAVVCANNAGQNTGMFSVDLSLLTLLDELRAWERVEVSYFNTPMRPPFDQRDATQGVSIETPSGTVIAYRKLIDPDEQLARFDRIVYWGDFLHARRYADIGVIPDDLARRCLLLAEAPVRLKEKVLAFGGCLYVNDAEAERDADYLVAIGGLYAAARGVYPRDPISTAHAARYAGFAGSVALGLDPAFLLDSARLLAWAGVPVPEVGGEARIGTWFGRSPLRDRMTALAARLGERIGAATVGLGWNDRSAEHPVVKVAQKIALLRSCSLVVTDTYHCAVNALREGVPTIAIGLGASHARRAIDDKKKELLFLTLNATERYVFSERLLYLDELDGLADRLASLAAAPGDPVPALRPMVEQGKRLVAAALLT
jgi:hypothetical protein